MSTLETLTTPLPGKGTSRCNRMACQRELTVGGRFWNLSTRSNYCISCARRINEGATEPICAHESTLTGKDDPEGKK